MIKVVLFGSGNVAQHLIIAFQQSGKVDIIQVVVRDKSKAELSISPDRITDNLLAIPKADIYILAVSDGAKPNYLFHPIELPITYSLFPKPISIFWRFLMAHCPNYRQSSPLAMR